METQNMVEKSPRKYYSILYNNTEEWFNSHHFNLTKEQLVELLSQLIHEIYGGTKESLEECLKYGLDYIDCILYVEVSRTITSFSVLDFLEDVWEYLESFNKNEQPDLSYTIS